MFSVDLCLLSQPQRNHNSIQPNITKVGFDTKLLHPPPTPYLVYPSQTQCQLYLSCFPTDFNQTLKVGFWYQQQQQKQQYEHHQQQQQQ